jgi:hypothetical protein
MYSDAFAWNMSFSKFTKSYTLLRDDDVCPVTITSMSIIPVVGSVADCFKASLISSNAMFTSFYSTQADSFILANASLIRISDSSCLGVADTVPFPPPALLI